MEFCFISPGLLMICSMRAIFVLLPSIRLYESVFEIGLTTPEHTVYKLAVNAI